MTNIFESLRADHDIQRDLIDELVATTGDSPDRHELFERLTRELTAHADQEERHFYVPLIRADLTQEKARHSVAEHHELDELVEKLETYEWASSQWLTTAEQLRHQLVHHLDEEEQEVFQLAGKVLTDDEKVDLGEQYRNAMTAARANA
ncbi:MAG: hemerythrin domain-containing protein [Acidimicrobiales bacterium]|nr:hemerythrin domain-containing protein [Acidimicrobiales bacterium]